MKSGFISVHILTDKIRGCGVSNQYDDCLKLRADMVMCRAAIFDGTILPPFGSMLVLLSKLKVIFLCSKKNCGLKVKQCPLVGSLIINKMALNASVLKVSLVPFSEIPIVRGQRTGVTEIITLLRCQA